MEIISRLKPITDDQECNKAASILRTFMCAAADTQLRISAIRLVTKLLASTPTGCEALRKSTAYPLIIRSLERESKYIEERMSALKLIRKITRVAPAQISREIVSSLVAITAHRDDLLKDACLEVLRELALVNTKLMGESGGLKSLISSIVDPALSSMSESVMLTIMYLLNQAHTRQYINTSDLLILLSPFTSSISDDATSKTARQLSKKAIVTMMQTWTGLIILSSDPQGLRSLVQMLVQPVSLELRRDVLDTILLIFNTINPLRAPSFTKGGEKKSQHGSEPYLAQYWGVGPGSAGCKELAAGGFHMERVPGQHVHMHSLLDNFLVMVLLSFIQCGLVEALIELSVSNDMSRVATQLLSFVIRFSVRLLPGAMSKRLLSQKLLVASAVDAARAGQVVDRARSQKAAQVISLLSRIVGSGYDTALATLLSRSACEDGLALASELCLAGSLSHMNLGVFPRSQIVTLPSVAESLAAAAKSAASAVPVVLRESNPSSGSANATTVVRRFSERFKKSVSRRLSKTSNNSPSLKTSNVGTEEESLADNFTLGNNIEGGALVVANRGHRRLVQQLVLTYLANAKDELLVKRLMEKTKILIKNERRAWKHWDWVCIEELLAGPFQTPAVCAEVLKTKFFKRLCAFYSCDSNGSFANLPWDPDYISYTNIGSMLFRLLLDLPDAQDFLINDRRGKLCVQMSEALQMELRHAQNESLVVAPSSKPGKERSNKDDDDDLDYDLNQQERKRGPRTFTNENCSQSMTRDFFVFLNLFASHKRGVEYLNQLNVFATLTLLSTHHEKDYLLRLAISHFDYCGSTNECRQWLQSLLMNKTVSPELRMFSLGFLRSLLRSAQTIKNETTAQWIITTVFALALIEQCSEKAVSVLLEASHYRLYLKVMVSMLNRELLPYKEVLKKPYARPLLIKFCGSEGGAEVLKKENWFSDILSDWNERSFMRYPVEIEKAISVNLEQIKNDAKKTSIPVRVSEASALSEPGYTSSELQWLFRLPWRMDMRVQSSVTGVLKVALDTYIDCASFALDGRVKIVAHCAKREVVISEDSDVFCSLALGNSPVDLETGRTIPSPVAGGGFRFSGAPDVMNAGMREEDRLDRGDKGDRDRESHADSLDQLEEEEEDKGDSPSISFNNSSVWIKCSPASRTAADGKEEDPFVSVKIRSATLLFKKKERKEEEDEFPDEREVNQSSTAAKEKSKVVINPLRALMEKRKRDGEEDVTRKTTASSIQAALTPALMSVMEVSFSLDLVPHRNGLTSIPTSLVGELAKTEDGVKLIDGADWITLYTNALRDEKRNIMEKRAAIWGLGHIGASEGGWRLLDRADVHLIHHIALNSACLSLRGTAIYALGLISRSKSGRDMLASLGWATLDVKTHPFATIAVYTNLSFSPFRAPKELVRKPTGEEEDDLGVRLSPVTIEEKVLEAVSDLSNHIAQKEAHATLMKLKESHPQAFSSVALFLKVHTLLARAVYQLPVRQFILGLFHSRINFESPKTWEVIDKIKHP